MNCDEINSKLKQLKIEDGIWIIYIGIIILSWYSNNLERKYFVYNDLFSKEKYRKIMIFIFFILVIIYMYFFRSSMDDLKNIKVNEPYNKKKLTYLSFIASLLILISGLIFLYIALYDDEISVELAFS